MGNHHCCQEHRSQLYKKYPEIFENNLNKGHGWNKGKSIKNGDKLLYAKSRKQITKDRISLALMGKVKAKRIITECKFCNKEILSLHSTIKKNGGQFCSKKCANIFLNTNRDYSLFCGKNNHNFKNKLQPHICEVCKKIFHSRKVTVRFCSNKCRHEGQREYVINILSSKIKFVDTDIEKIIESWLISNNIFYKKQKPLMGITVVDFFIEPNVCLYCDGDYWHNLPEVKNRDEKINNQLNKLEYKVIRLLGSQIKNGERPLL